MTLPGEALEDAQGWDDNQSAHIFFWYFGTCMNICLIWLSLSRLSPLPRQSLWPRPTNNPIEARNNATTAPTSIYLGGGPGASSLDGLSDFPCFVNADSNSTTLNEFSWNNNVNMLYIDQPLGAGFSYVTLLNGTMDFLSHKFSPIEDEDSLPPLNVTTVQATLDSTATMDIKNAHTIPLTTMSAARTMWNFVQVWLNE